MNIDEFKKEFTTLVYENPEDAALSALTALILKDILPDQKERFNYIKDFLTSTGFSQDMPVLAKVKEIYHLYLENEKKAIATLFEAEKNIARFLQDRRPKCDSPQKNPSKNCCQPKKETVINKWW